MARLGQTTTTSSSPSPLTQPKPEGATLSNQATVAARRAPGGKGIEGADPQRRGRVGKYPLRGVGGSMAGAWIYIYKDTPTLLHTLSHYPKQYHTTPSEKYKIGLTRENVRACVV